MDEQQTTSIRGLGEIALRVDDLDGMRAFYEDVVGLRLMKRFEHAVFLRIAEGYGGHTQILALFDRAAAPNRPDFFETTFRGVDQPGSPLDHLAFEIDLSNIETERRRLESLGVEIKPDEFGFVHWRSIFFRDPEGNMVEFVAYDESVT
ncbi:MAG: VOC family protein [Phycisphaerales bacterium]